MNVLHININYASTPLHKNMINALARIGINNTVFVPTCKEVENQSTDLFDVIVSKCYRYWDGLSFFYKQNKIIRAMNKNIDIRKFDLIHAYTVSTDGNVAYWLHRKFGFKYVVAVRNTDLNYFFKKRIHLRWLGVKILLKAEKIFFLSQTYQNELIEKYIPIKYRAAILEKSKIIPNGIDSFWLMHLHNSAVDVKKIKRFEQKKIKLVFAGRIEKPKNCRLTADAIKILENRGWKVEYHVAGKILYKKDYDYISKLDGFVYHGVLDKNKMIELYRECDIYVMPSHTETFGLTYVEAITQGLPVIYTKGQGFDGQFSEGKVGYHVSDSDSIELAACIEKCIRNYTLISRNLKDCSEKFDWEKIAPQYMHLYEEIVK